MVVRCSFVLATAALVTWLTPPASAMAAEPGDGADGDRMAITIGADTYLRLFERAALPGPGGSVVDTTLSAPLYQYASFRVADIDLPWQADSTDVELAAWGNVAMGESGDSRRVDGDITVASVRHRFGPAYARLGRQLSAGGAARLSHFDGAAVGVRLPFGLGADGYGGLTVLPRWNDRPGYHHLGSAADSLIRTPTPSAPDAEFAPEPRRADHWLAGGRLYYSQPSLGQLGLSFHEQHEFEGLGRRNLGADLRVTPHDMVAAYGVALVDGDAWGLTEARFGVDVLPLKELALTAELLHATPALFLSRQSVLSVFSTDPFDEVGGGATVAVLEGLQLGAAGYGQRFGDGELGMRLRGHIRFVPGSLRRLTMRAGYHRVAESANGYHAPRVALSYRIIDPLTLTADSYFYIYDTPIRGVDTAWVGAANARWAALDDLSLLLGGSLSRTPYGSLDGQGIARLELDMDWVTP